MELRRAGNPGRGSFWSICVAARGERPRFSNRFMAILLALLISANKATNLVIRVYVIVVSTILAPSIELSYTYFDFH